MAARLTRDWGAAPVADGRAGDGGTAGDVVVDASAMLPGIPADTAAWSVGQWAVATASVTGVSAVVVGDLAWERGPEGWNPAGDSAQPAGLVRVG